MPKNKMDIDSEHISSDEEESDNNSKKSNKSHKKQKTKESDIEDESKNYTKLELAAQILKRPGRHNLILCYITILKLYLTLF
jgi:hypothetical protein